MNTFGERPDGAVRRLQEFTEPLPEVGHLVGRAT
jgi:hypothetical protein